ncbi:transglycosylase SLT domain-containing protein [Streptomyces neyagawaensis]|uniref:Transglycosylase SLT domain-containing protein n=1 Tax=Streptomyces neyagawaensis TaxID=42238 RepID=A0ABV3B8W0_9ACTN
MSLNAKNPGHSPVLSKAHKLSFAGVAAVGAAAVAFSLVPAEAQTATKTVSVAPVAFSQSPAQTVKASVVDQAADAAKKAAAVAAQQKAAQQKAAQQKAAQERAKKEAASRSAKRAAQVKAAAAKSYPNNLDGWIREALDIMKKHKIPGTYQGLHKNIMRESSGNPRAINNWDINAQNGVPSIGLLQVIKPTFDAYHVPGTAWSQYDPVANLTAAANYAADRYGSIDNVNSAY